MELIDLIEYISIPDETGFLTIKQLTNSDFKSLNSIVINHSISANKKYQGPVYFGDKTWRESTSDAISFKDLPEAFEYEIKAITLLAIHSGLYEGGDGNKFGTISLYIRPLIKFGKYLSTKKVNSLREFNELHPIKKKNYFINFITVVLELDSDSNFSYSRFFQQRMNYGVFSESTVDIFWDAIDTLGVRTNRNNTVYSHSIIPTGILKSIISDCEKKLTHANSVFDDWEKVNRDFVKAIGNKELSNIENQTSSITTGLNFNSQLKLGYDAFNNLKLNVLIYILAYTGMRKEEALSCKIGCATKKDGRYYIEALLTKTDEGEIRLKWIANQAAYNAVILLEKYILAMHERASIILKKRAHIITDDLKHRLTFGLDRQLLFGVSDTLTSIKFTEGKLGQESSDTTKNGKFSFAKINYPLTATDLDQLESLNCNYKAVRGKNKGEKYVEGDIFHITPHMFRHNFAWFIIANRLGELDDIKHQFKHLASSMTLIYASRGYESIDEMLHMFDDFEELLVETIASQLAEEASEGDLLGAGGERLNKGAKSLIFDVSGASDTGRTIKQIHFKDLNAYKDFLVKNLKNIRGLPHGYCTGGAECKLKNVGLPTGCVYCPNYVVTSAQKIHWSAMKNQADSKLKMYEGLTPAQQEEHSLLAQSWKHTIYAADVILTDKKPLHVKDSAA